MNKRIILASTSQRRKELLSRTGLTFDVIPGEYEEDMTLPLPPKELVMHLSEGKALDVAQKYKDAIVIGADTIVVLGDKALGKPHTKERAKEMLNMLNGGSHSIITAFTIANLENNKVVTKAVETKVYFKQLTDKEIDNYIATGEPLDRAGAYAIQQLGGQFVEKIEGDYDNTVGLPVQDVINTLVGDFRLNIANLIGY